MAFPVDNTRVNLTGKFGPRGSFKLPNGRWTNAYHYGVDLAPEVKGQTLEVYAVDNAVVHSVGTRSDAGRYIIIRTPDNALWRYCHLSSYSVRAGQVLTDGQMIGRMGTTGNSTGVHLHLERYPNNQLNKRVDPLPYIWNEWNPAKGKSSAPAPAPAPSQPKEHVVSAGETLGGIAKRYNLRWQDLASSNGIKTPYIIKPGQRLKLSAAAPAPAPAPSPITTHPGDVALGSILSLQRWVGYTDSSLRTRQPELLNGHYRVIGIVDGKFKVVGTGNGRESWVANEAKRGLINVTSTAPAPAPAPKPAPAPTPAPSGSVVGRRMRLSSRWGKFRTYGDAQRLRNQWGWFPAGTYTIIGTANGQYKIQSGGTVGWINGKASAGIL